MRKRTRKTLWIVGIVIAVILIALLAASQYMLDFALCPAKNKGRNYASQYAVMKSRYPWISHWMDSIQGAKAMKDTFVIAHDGDRHHALIIKAPKPTSRTAVIVPGYTDCAINMLHVGYIYNNVLGMNLVIPDLHANGKSDGKAMQMGWKDRIDVIQWIAIADSLFKDSTGHAWMIVHGQSMGAATTMNVSGELAEPSAEIKTIFPIISQIASSVKCFVEDCGYTSAWDEFSYEINNMFGLTDFPIMYAASALCKIEYGWTFGGASPVSQVAKCRKPMLFIHGGSDDFVPTRMVYTLYNVKPAPRYLQVFPDSRHARSYQNHRREYEQRIKTYVEKYNIIMVNFSCKDSIKSKKGGKKGGKMSP